jgi:photosystem II stability/assembly factor-like uncharacterized protein
MKRYFGFILAGGVALLLGGCFGKGGSSASAPTNFTVVAKDGRVIVSWDMAPGVTYWLWRAIGAGVTPENCSSITSCSISLSATSPTLVSGLTNGTLYSFSVNGRINGGPGGPGSTSVSATPRLAGATWSTGTALSSGALRGVAYGYGNIFVATGDSGALFYSTDGNAWSRQTSPVSTTLNAINYNITRGRYYSVGASGTVIVTADFTTTWSAQTSNTPNDLYAVANSGSNTDSAGNYITVATGANGTIIYNADGGTTWTNLTASSGTTSTLYGATFGYDNLNLRYVFVAVGASKTLLYSLDYGATWLAGTCASCSGTPDLKSVTYGGVDSSGYSLFAAVGTGGTVLTSEDGMNWTNQTSTGIPATSDLNAITFSPYRRFMAVAADGNIYYSEYYRSDGLTGNGATTWAPVTPQVTFSSLYAITVGGLYDYSAVGATGINLYAD